MAHPSTLNNKAVHQIQDGRYHEAISTLTKALKTVKLVASGDAMISGTIEDESPESDFHCEFITTSRASSFLRIVEKGGICESSIFRDPIHITGALLPATALENCELLSYVILYNLALSHHLRSMEEQTERTQTECLQKALTLYEHAHHIMTNQEADVALLHTMAITSNLGNIHLMLGDEERAHRCSQHLLSTILYIVDAGEARKIEVLDGFFRNVMPLITNASSAPAA
jgi:hypothetical protein